MKSLGMEEVYTYILHRQNTVSHYITNRLILELCLAAERQLEAQVSMIWWGRAGINLG